MLDGRNLISVKVVPPYRNCAFSLSLSTACCANEQQIFAKRTSWSTSSGSICNLLRICVFVHPWTLTWNLKRSVVEVWRWTELGAKQPSFSGVTNRRLNFGGANHLPRSQVGSGSREAPLSATNGVLGAHRAGNASAFVGTSVAWRGTKEGPSKVAIVRCRGSITPFWVFP